VGGPWVEGRGGTRGGRSSTIQPGQPPIIAAIQYVGHVAYYWKRRDPMKEYFFKAPNPYSPQSKPSKQASITFFVSPWLGHG